MIRIRQFFRPFKEFLAAKITGGYILLLGVIIALVLVNSPLKDSFHHLFTAVLGIQIGHLTFTHDLHFWINDGLMAIFFLLVGLEIKRELIEGELSDFKKSSLPILSALGGMIVPAAIYALFNYGGIGANGWGIPMATDIAFAVAILSILGKRIPLSLKIFLTALAIVDDLGAILVIAFFYTQSLAFNYLFYSLIVLIILYLLNISRVKSIMMYVPFGILLWYFIYKSGIHATIAGVLFAFMIPTNKGKNMSPLEQLEHILNKPVSYLIMPLFALSNTDIIFSAESWQALRNPIGIGIVGGLLFGKVIGIVSFAYLSIKLKLSSLPTGTNWKQLIGAGFLGGIGFTMSIFIALLSFPETEMQSISKFAILFASITSGLVGYLILRTGAEVENKDELIEA
jgi:Na+:H+ antiporter, NhaA family